MTNNKSPQSMSDAEYVEWISELQKSMTRSAWEVDGVSPKDWDEQTRKWHDDKNASPDYQRRIKNTAILLPILFDMIYRCGPKPIYPEDEDQRWQKFIGQFRPYCSIFHSRLSNQLPTLGEVGRMDSSILDACIAARTPFKVGASLYLYQQMVDRNDNVDAPSLSKAQWLFTSAPLALTHHQIRTDGGSHEQIGKEWKNYFDVSHYWAAFAVLSRTPLQYQDSLPLNFVCNIDADEFLRMAAAFFDFRRRANVVFAKRRGQSQPFVKHGLDAVPRDLEGICPIPYQEIPDLLEDYQWAALKHYRPNHRNSA